MNIKDLIIAALIFVVGYILVFEKSNNHDSSNEGIRVKISELTKKNEKTINDAFRKIDSIQLIENEYKLKYHDQKNRNKNLERMLSTPVDYTKQYLDSIGANFRHEVRDYTDNLLPAQ